MLGHGFFFVDDATYVTDNPQIARGLTSGGLRWAATSIGYASNWHPLAWISHMLDAELFGLDPRGHHLTNLLLHAANAVLLFAVLASMTGTLWRPALAAAVFAVHPLHVESMAWVAERKDLLSGLFWLLTLAAYTVYARRPGSRRYLVVAGLFCLGLLSKPMVVSLPLVLLFVDWWPLGRAPCHRSDGGGRSWVRLVIEKVPLLLLAAGSAAMTLTAQRRGGAVVGFGDLELTARLGNAVVAVQHYIGAILWPSGLAVFYPYPEGGIGVWSLASAVLLIAGVTAAALWFRARWPHLGAGWLWFLTALVPVLGLVQVGGQAAADRYTYLPKIGILFMICWSLPRARAAGFARAVAVAMAVAAILALSLASRRQIALWADGVAIARVAATANPGSWQAQFQLANAAIARGRGAEAAAAYTRTLEILPVLKEAHQGLGRILLDEGDPAAAEVHFAQAARIDFRDAKARFNHGVALAALGRGDESIEDYYLATRLDPLLLPAWGNLALELARAGRNAEARSTYDTALGLFADSPELRFNAGQFRLDQGDAEGAILNFAEALRLRPGYRVAAAALEEARGMLE